MLDWREVYDWAGLRVARMVRAEYPANITEILDVGAGQGKYGRLLREFPLVDACEVWQPYVIEHDLTSLYREVYNCEIQTLVLQRRAYDVTILGDVLEHLAADDAQWVVNELCHSGADVIVVVPYLYEQGPEHGNHYQRHLQPDLTPEVMARRYAQLRLVALESRDGEPFKGIYRRRSRA